MCVCDFSTASFSKTMRINLLRIISKQSRRPAWLSTSGSNVQTSRSQLLLSWCCTTCTRSSGTTLKHGPSSSNLQHRQSVTCDFTSNGANELKLCYDSMNEWMNEWISLCSPPLIETYHEGAVCPSYACLYSSVLSLLVPCDLGDIYSVFCSLYWKSVPYHALLFSMFSISNCRLVLRLGFVLDLRIAVKNSQLDLKLALNDETYLRHDISNNNLHSII